MLSAIGTRIRVAIAIIVAGAILSVLYVDNRFNTRTWWLLDECKNLPKASISAAVPTIQPESNRTKESNSDDEVETMRKVYAYQAGDRKKFVENMYTQHQNKKNRKKGIGLLYNVLAPEVRLPNNVFHLDCCGTRLWE